MKTSRFFLFFVLLSAGIVRGQTNPTTLALSAGQHHALALRSDGSVWAWGTNQVGELGLGTNNLAMWPTHITSLSNIISISAGALHSLAVQSNGTVWAWGLNSDGRLGNGTFTTANTPVPVSLITNAVMVSAGGNHSLALLANGSVMVWGANYGGQLGTGNTVSTNRPVQAGSFTNVIAVAAGTNFSLALTADGNVWAWGTNNFGQLGLGSTTSQLSPVKISALSNIVQIAVGSSHCLALDSNGVVYAWGRNTEGELDDGTTINATLPEIVPEFGSTTNFGAVAWITAGYNSSAAVLKTGRLFYWGAYGNGSIYSNTTHAVELNPNTGLDFQTAAYGDSYLLAGQADGSTWAWGFNQYGTWGNGTTYDPGDTWRYDSANAEFSFSASPYPRVTRFNRGDRNDFNYGPMLPYNSFVLPLDMEQGVKLDNYGGDIYCYGAGTPWFLQVQKTERQHVWRLTFGTTNVSRFQVDNPVVAFGSDAGARPLYAGETYRFGIYAGAYDERTTQTNRIRILVYDRSAFGSGATNVAPINIINIALPRLADSNAWANFVTNGNCVVVQTNDLRTVVQFHDAMNTYSSWDLGPIFEAVPGVDVNGYVITQTATSTNYCYVVEGIGSAEVGANVFTPMGVTNNTGWAYLPLYAMSFDTFPAWRSHFVDNPYFLGTPLPPTYTGRSPMELNGLTAVITNQIWLTNNPAFTNLDDSPELRRSPILDQFVNDMGRNPLALANYVINEIGLTDPMGDFEYSQYFNDSVCVGGVNRSALGTFLEGRGSPVEQCALLVYLLRAAGYPAAYVWPTNSNLKLMDTTLSRLWQINVHGVIWDSGVPVVTNSLITVNYPWVVANIGTNTVQIFPWLKNTEIVEGQNIYDYAPTNYPDAYSWVKAYAFADPSLMALGDPNDGIMPVWKKWLTDVINTNSLQSNLSLDDFGVRAFDRRNTYTSWSQLPVPDFLTNQSQAAVVQTLSDSSITYPFLTNMFDRIRIQVFNNNTNASNQIFDTGLWRACDLENRKLLLYTNTPSTASLWMDSYRPGITAVTNFQNFDSGTNALDIQIAQTSVPNTVSNFQVLITYERRDGTLAEPANWFPSAVFFSGPAGVLTCSRQDMTAIIPGVSRVTQPMLQVYADDYQRLEQEKAANTNFVPAVTDEAGDSAMILASSFFQKLWDDDQFNQHLQKVRAMTWFSDGTAALTPLSSGYMQVKLNMNWFATQVLGNGSLRQDSGDKGFNSLNNYLTMLQAEGSSAEHSVIASVWGDPNPVSSIRLLQLAAQRAVSNGFAPPLELNIDNYNALGSQSYAGYGGTLLENQIPGFWAQATSPFTSEWDSNLVRVLMTPGPVTNVTSSFKGMSALIFGQWQNGAVMTSDQITLNGGWSDEMAWIGAYDDYPSYDLAYTLDYSPSVGYSFIFNNLTTPQPQFDFSPYSALTMTSGGSGQTAQVAFTPQQITQASVIAAGLNLSSASPAAAIRAEKDTGWFGRAWAGIKQAGTLVAEPVQVVSGNLYADDVDMTLAGPMPLQLRRNYLSGDLADGPFGAGWKLSFTPWLVLTTNAANDQLIDAAEPDGSVLAYRYQSNSLWTVTAADNPDLVNFTASGIGGKANLFNNFIEQNPTNSAIYTLFGSDGSRRTYEVMTNFAITAGTNQMDRIRSYLTRWQDHAGNYYQFTYGTNPTNNDFGQLYRVQGANGASLTFKYDFYGRIIEAISDDDRIMRYQYDNYGDLVSATLPDDSQWQYGYDHYTFTTNGLTYTDSDHLLTSVTKPDGRQFVNAYDNLRRVVMQEATVGVNRELITNAWFYYTNDCTGLTNDYISGVTRMDDVFSNSYFYYYTSNLVTEIRQPLGRTNIQSWFDTSQSNQPGYYQRGLQFAVDVRGLTNAFLYDSNGNATNRIVYGDLTGSGIGGQSATNTCTYTTNNCLATATSPSGNEVTFRYGNASDPYQLTSLEFSSGGIGVSTNLWSYTNVTTTVDMGGWSETNSSFGLCNQEVLGDSATNQWLYNGRGFPVQLTRYAASAETPNDADPPVVEYFSFTPRGDLATATDADGRQADMTYDEMGRLQWRDVLDQNSNAISRENFYYNQNGQLEWYDGPRYNPDDYVYFSYDGAGRKVQEIRWRSRVNANATGIEPETGDNLYGTTFYTYDPFGNLTFVRDQRGAFTTNFWDALGRLSQRNFYDTNGATVLATEGFGYEAGGLIQYYTNALGGVAETLYNGRGQPRFRKNADNSTNAWTYYLDGRMDREIQGNGAYWETTYNDPARTVTRIFHSVSGAPLATNVMVFDSRANPVQWTDAGGNTFTRTFDGLDRVRRTAGPAIVTVLQTGMSPGGPYTYVTNVLEQAVTNFYDAANDAVTNVNEPGDRTVTTFDALGRATGVRTYAFNSVTPLRVTTVAYAPDNNSYTITRGTGANAISTTTYTDPEDRPLLSVAYPSPGTTDVVLRQYDSVGNLLSESQGSVIASSLAAWKTKSFTYDGLNRVTRMIDRDDALTTFSYDSAGDIQQRAMPGNLAWSATYNNAGQILTEKDSNGAQTARSMSYTYYPSGNPDAGLLDTLADGNGVTQTRTYDDWLRLTNVTTTGALPEQQMTRDWQFDARGFLTDMTQSFANPATGPSSEVKRSFDPYGQLSTEAVYLNGGQSAEADQSWDAAGRRTRLSFGFGDWQEGFQYQADDLMTSANGAAFGYADNGLLIGRTNAFRSYFVNQRDGEGRPLDATTTVSGITQLMESWSWLGDGSPAGYTAARGDFTDTRDYDYASLSRRLTGETFNVSATQSVTNIYTFDNGATGGLGILTKAVESSGASNLWSGGEDAFSRVTEGTNTVAHRPAWGTVNGKATVEAFLDGVPVAVTVIGTNGGQWRATLDLTPGTHQLTASAIHPSGLFVTNVTVTFTNHAADNVEDAYDGDGQITNRVWLSSNGQTNRTQSLTWDAFGRLVKVIERDSRNDGYNWQAVFDPLGRRVQTTIIVVTNGVLISSQPSTIAHYYDPQVKFLEIGVNVNDGLTTWKTYGPDSDGIYGGEQGLGGLESLTTGLTTVGVIQDGFGNILGSITNGAVDWNPARVDSYGPVDGYPALSLESSPLTAAHLAWRGKWRDVTGLYYWGARPYDPERRAFISSDPFGHSADDSLYCAFDGQPTVYWDPDGRFGKPVLQAQWRNANAAAGWAVDQFVNVFAGSGYVLNQAAYRVTGEPGFAASAMAYQREMSPYARQGYYNPNTPTAKLATTATIFVSPESSAGRLGTVDSAVTRNVAPTITREIAPITKPAAIQGGVMNNSMRLLVAPQQPVALLPENTVSLAAGRMTQQRFNFLSKLTSRQWPPNYGFLNQGRATLIPGTMVDRFGSDVGSFVSPVGTPFWQRSLPASFASKPYSVFQVMRPIEVRAGTVAPAFGMAGLGTQFQFHLSVEELVEEGYLNPAQRGF